tara:strand:- start:134 stop:853 length:720 start_codon:yes stop_codon:yes gene_type:complete
MATYTLSQLESDLRDYTEVDSTIFTGAVLSRFIENAETRILRDVNIDADRKSQTGSLVVGQEYINAPAGCLVVRSVQVTEDDTTPDTLIYLQKRDVTFINEYNNYGSAGSTVATGRDIPKYYAMYGGATGITDTTSGTIMFAPCPDKTYTFQVNYVKLPTSLVTNTSGTYISRNFANGLLYASLVEAFGYLKGPQDMLTYYEQRYTKEIEKFAIEQVGRRRRDDYDDGAIRIKIDSPSP